MERSLTLPKLTSKQTMSEPQEEFEYNMKIDEAFVNKTRQLLSGFVDSRVCVRNARDAYLKFKREHRHKDEKMKALLDEEEKQKQLHTQKQSLNDLKAEDILKKKKPAKKKVETKNKKKRRG